MTSVLNTGGPATASTQNLEIRPFDAPLGAEVLGLDSSQPLAADDFARIHRAHLEHHVLVFRKLTGVMDLFSRQVVGGFAVLPQRTH